MSRIPVVVVLKCSENTVVETLSICSDCALTGEAWTRGGCVLRSSRWQSVFEPLTGGCALASDAVSSSVTTRYSVKNNFLKITKGMKKKNEKSRHVSDVQKSEEAKRMLDSAYVFHWVDKED